MMGYYGWSGMFFGGLFFLVLIVFIIVVIVRLSSRTGHERTNVMHEGGKVEGPGGKSHALEILDERYAKGELTEEQFNKMKDQLK